MHILKDGYIRATQLSALNDPLEGTYCVDGLRDLASHFDDMTPDEVIAHIERSKNYVGVICLTEAKDNLLMWSHYADQHRGALVGIFVDHPFVSIFEDLFPFEQSTGFAGEEYALFTGKCLPVQYRKQPRYRVDRFDFDYSNISAEREDRLLFEIFQQKSDEWIYEKEHRITLRLEQADLVQVVDLEALNNAHLIANIKQCGVYSEEVRNGEVQSTLELSKLDSKWRSVYSAALAPLSVNPRNLYLFKLTPNAISSVILGCKAKPELIDPMPSFASSRGRFEVLRASLDESHYGLRILPSE